MTINPYLALGVRPSIVRTFVRRVEIVCQRIVDISYALIATQHLYPHRQTTFFQKSAINPIH
jgi:hypothetical protein